MASVTFDPRFRTMYINFTGKPNKVTKTITVADGQELDIDKAGSAVGLEVLFSSDMSKEATEALLKLVKNSRKRSLVFHALRRDVELVPSHKASHKPKLISR
ncbi:MAG: DUF2283 domain-containing protein [Nitrososphaeraceae archaeon]